MADKVITWPHKLAEQVGPEAVQEVVDMINDSAATRVAKSDYDAHVQLINARFDNLDLRMEKFEANVKAQVRGALLAGLAWVTVSVGGLFAALFTYAEALIK